MKKMSLFVFSCLTENLVPNIFLELFFVMQLLTSQSPQTHDDDDEQESLCAANSGVKLDCVSPTSYNIKITIVIFRLNRR